jgi:hypothetical protein
MGPFFPKGREMIARSFSSPSGRGGAHSPLGEWEVRANGGAAMQLHYFPACFSPDGCHNPCFFSASATSLGI